MVSGTCLVWAFSAREYIAMIFFAFFAGMGVYIILGTGEITIDSDGVRHHSLFGRYGIRWDEIRRIEFGAGDGTFVLHGDRKRFVISPISMWSGSQKANAIALLDEKLRNSGITLEPSRIAAYKWNKNVNLKN
ncbi:MAG TPA: PH domain-containing protein [Candidatus Acidoferrum sp.]|nr:PH domain-containing protein [Candidatus Acidoferrum sp.]